MDTIALSDLRADLPSVIKKISVGLDRLIVTVSGKPKAVLMSLEEAEAIEETAEILAVPGTLKDIKAGLKQAKKKQGTPLRDLL
jgi:prevent-host-death family protein